jgi:hypothetical protein
LIAAEAMLTRSIRTRERNKRQINPSVNGANNRRMSVTY